VSEPDRFHCCATCIHFRVEKEAEKTRYRCARLSYETRPDYRFNCWSPKEQVRRLMNKQEER
jgi:hypothetical protein